MKRKKLTKMCAWLVTAAILNLSPVQAAEFDSEIPVETEDLEIEQDVSTEEAEETEPEEDTVSEENIAMESEPEQDEASEVFSSDDSSGRTADAGTEETFTDETANPLETGITRLEGQIYVSDNGVCSDFQEAEITNDLVTERTADGKQQTWRQINLIFPAASVKPVKTGNTTFRFYFKIETEDSDTPVSGQIQIGSSYYLCDGDKLREKSTETYNSTSGLWSSNFATYTTLYGESTEKWSTRAFCIYKNNNKVIRYKINIVRQGSAGIQHEPLYNESNPVPVRWVYDEDMGMYMADINELPAATDSNYSSKVYDENGTYKGFLKWNNITSRDPDADFYVDDEYLYVKKAGQYNIFTASWAGKDYYMPVRFTYDLHDRAPRALDELWTDGVISLDDYASAEIFAAAFPEKDREKAKEYYKLVTGLRKTLEDTEYEGTRRGEWDYSVYNKKWADTCESVKIDQAKSEYASVWENIFGKKDAEDTIVNYIDLEHCTSDKKDQLEKLQETYLNRLTQDYQNGKIRETLDVQDILKEMHQAVDVVKGVKVKKVDILKYVPSSYTRTEGDKGFNLNIRTNVSATLSYTSSDKKVVTVNAKGTVSVKGPGRAVITVKASAPNMNTQYAKINIAVKPSNKLSVSIKAQKGKKLLVSWKRNSKVSGYQIAISTDKKFRKNVKTVTINSKKTNHTTIKKLKKGKRYYVRMRSFKKTSGGTVYSAWKNSKSGAVRVK